MASNSKPKAYGMPQHSRDSHEMQLAELAGSIYDLAQAGQRLLDNAGMPFMYITTLVPTLGSNSHAVPPPLTGQRAAIRAVAPATATAVDAPRAIVAQPRGAHNPDAVPMNNVRKLVPVPVHESFPILRRRLDVPHCQLAHPSFDQDRVGGATIISGFVPQCRQPCKNVWELMAHLHVSPANGGHGLAVGDTSRWQCSWGGGKCDSFWMHHRDPSAPNDVGDTPENLHRHIMIIHGGITMKEYTDMGKECIALLAMCEQHANNPVNNVAG